MGCLVCVVFLCTESGKWKLRVSRFTDLDHDKPGYQVLGKERELMEVGDVKILGHGDIIYPGSLEDSYRIDMNPPLTHVKPWKPMRASSNFLYDPIYRFLSGGGHS